MPAIKATTVVAQAAPTAAWPGGATLTGGAGVVHTCAGAPGQAGHCGTAGHEQWQSGAAGQGGAAGG